MNKSTEKEILIYGAYAMCIGFDFPCFSISIIMELILWMSRKISEEFKIKKKKNMRKNFGKQKNKKKIKRTKNTKINECVIKLSRF